MAYENNNKYAAELYAKQEAEGYFTADPKSTKEHFCMMLPPPNITGSLHVGHAASFMRQDVIARYQRMKGKDVLWLPGTDHAAMPVQMLVEKKLAAEGINFRTLGREGFLKHVWEWIELYGGEIRAQLRRMGFSLDWSREAFTMSPHCNSAVIHAFKKMYEDGLIYRATRMVNWDPAMQTSVSDLEVINSEEAGTFWHIAYPVEDSVEKIVVATTRPETMLGDTAVAVNPDDERYKHLIGKFVILPLVGRRIPIVADAYADMTKGTGAVKITPAHDFNDYEVGKRHNLDEIQVINKLGKICGGFVPALEGLDRFAARAEILKMLTAEGSLVKEAPCTHTVPRAERGNTILEPMITPQWFCDVSKLAAESVAKARSGELKFVPEVWVNTWYSWLENIQPWCISRQIWWGHRVPVYYDAAGKVAYVGDNPPAGLIQDEDSLDTWFSSGLWPLETLGWPDENAVDFKTYFPNQFLGTAHDIIFFWVARMVMMSIYFTGKLPFDTVMLNGMIVDEAGQKMSKTKGNVISPMNLVDEFGIDAVRFAICAACNQNRVNPFGVSNVENARKFLTKLLNGISFWEMKGVASSVGGRYTSCSPACCWILDRMDKMIADADKAMLLSELRFDEYAQNIYHFVWDDFCSTFIEAAKKDMSQTTVEVARFVIGNILKVLQPVAPFIAAELWQKLGFGNDVDLIREGFAEIADLNSIEEEVAEKFALDLEIAAAKAKAEGDKAAAAKELAEIAARIESLNKQLADKLFVSRAKPEVIEARKRSLAEMVERQAALLKV
ncbi:MAG: valine--tRNA ligase [Alphaproteobacteria bacterium]|nr:valine--tRNA ligase [Alphaproteobacteria bacterium]